VGITTAMMKRVYAYTRLTGTGGCHNRPDTRFIMAVDAYTRLPVPAHTENEALVGVTTAMMERVYACCPCLQLTSTVNMGGDVGALLAQSGWLFVGVPNQIKVRSSTHLLAHAEQRHPCTL